MFKHKRSQSGFGIVEALCFIVMFSMVGLIGWYVINENQNSQETLDNIGGAEVQTSSAKPAAASEKFVFENLGVAIIPPAGLEGLKYISAGNDSPYPGGQVVMKDLSDIINQCNGESTSDLVGFAYLQRNKNSEKNEEAEGSSTIIKQFDGFFISVSSPSGVMCENEELNNKRNTLSQKYKLALTEAFKTATLVE